MNPENLQLQLESMVEKKQAELLERLSTDPRIVPHRLETLEKPIQVKVVQVDTYVHPDFEEVATITWKDNNLLTFHIDGFIFDLWYNQPTLDALIEHELLHIPTKYDIPNGPQVKKIMFYSIKKETHVDLSQEIVDGMYDTLVDKFLPPKAIDEYYDTLLVHQLLLLDEQVHLVSGDINIDAVKTKLHDFLSNAPISVSGIYPWVLLIPHTYMRTVAAYRNINRPLLEDLVKPWISQVGKFVLALHQLFRKVLTQKDWQQSYVAEFDKIVAAKRKYGYYEADFEVTIKKK